MKPIQIPWFGALIVVLWATSIAFLLAAELAADTTEKRCVANCECPVEETEYLP